jgi:hypothetical protein
MDVPGRWAGGFRAWDEHGVYLATGRGAAAGWVLRVPAEVLRERVSAWFPLGRHLIEGLYRTARSIESTVRQRESLITLGSLAAGLAYEINNPAAAATRAVDDLEAACRTLMLAVGRLAREELPARQFTAPDTMLLSEIKESTRRISALVAAIKSYSQMDRASIQHISVTDGLESTLVMLSHKLGGGVTVVRDYGPDVPRIHASPASSTRCGPTSSTTPSTPWTARARSGWRRGPRETAFSSRSGIPAAACRRRWRPVRSRPSSPPRTRARAPASASTSHSASSWSGTAARSPSTRGQAKRYCGSASPPGGPSPAARDPVPAHAQARTGRNQADAKSSKRKLVRHPARE